MRRIVILMADKHNIPKGKIHSNCMLLPDYIVCKITHRNNMKRANTCNPALKLQNEVINFRHIQTQINIRMERTCRCTLGSQAQHTMSYSLETIHGLSNRAPLLTLNTSITFNYIITTTPKTIANCFPKQITNMVRHATRKKQIH